jgi:hypothetical protein
MKTNAHCSDHTGKVRIVATFGDTQLVRHVNGPYELCGGSASDRTAAREWISFFLHEAVVSFPQPVRNSASCERTINESRLDIRHSQHAASPGHESLKPWVNVFGHEDMNGRLTNRKPLKD